MVTRLKTTKDFHKYYTYNTTFKFKNATETKSMCYECTYLQENLTTTETDFE